ncbi:MULTISPECIES: hypothetical protein [Serratia]|uniref:hypothetical protein n=1 Tax=Serratia TaxID=613 RepID=UPI0013DE4B41|nr:MULTISPECIES: hypothetical protein [Serratia]HEJ8082628.1 hypothetical protein [Serratia marcescens]
MTENEKEFKGGPYSRVLTEDFFKFLDKNSVTTNCVMCGNGVSIVSETSKANLANPYQTITYVTLFKHVPVIPTEHVLNYYYMLHCEKCGFNTTFSAHRVHSWLTAQQVKESTEGKDE